jgi:hypothetical protein
MPKPFARAQQKRCNLDARSSGCFTKSDTQIRSGLRDEGGCRRRLLPRESQPPEQALSLACLLPKDASEPQLVAIPLALPMGWVESPPYFCAVTETIADLANSRLSRTQVPYHRLEQ